MQYRSPTRKDASLISLQGCQIFFYSAIVDAQELVLSGGHIDKVRLALGAFFIEELVLGLFVERQEALAFDDLVSVSYRFSRELEHSDQNLNTLEELLEHEEVFSLEHLLTLCEI